MRKTKMHNPGDRERLKPGRVVAGAKYERGRNDE